MCIDAIVIGRKPICKHISELSIGGFTKKKIVFNVKVFNLKVANQRNYTQ